MKKNVLFFLAISGLLAMVSCRRSTAEEPSAGLVPTCPLTVTIATDPSTKSAYADRKDYQISSVQIIVFDGQNRMETDYFTTVTPTDDPVSVEISTFTGPKNVYALINHERITLGKDRLMAAFENTLSDLNENSPTNLVMVGRNQVVVNEYDKNKDPDAEPQEVNIYLKRLAAMVVLDKVTVDFTGTALEGATFTIQEMYLKNVVGKCYLGLDGYTNSHNKNVAPYPLEEEDTDDVDNWYNVITKQATGAPAVTVDTQEMSLSNVSGGDGNTVSRCLFAYPNPITTDSHKAYNPSASLEWEARKTRLVIKAFVSKSPVITNPGTNTYYVFDMPVLEANHIYRISNIKITALGKDSDNTDDNLQAGKVNPNMITDDWTPTTTMSFEF